MNGKGVTKIVETRSIPASTMLYPDPFENDAKELVDYTVTNISTIMRRE